MIQDPQILQFIRTLLGLNLVKTLYWQINVTSDHCDQHSCLSCKYCTAPLVLQSDRQTEIISQQISWQLGLGHSSGREAWLAGQFSNFSMDRQVVDLDSDPVAQDHQFQGWATGFFPKSSKNSLCRLTHLDLDHQEYFSMFRSVQHCPNSLWTQLPGYTELPEIT